MTYLVSGSMTPRRSVAFLAVTLLLAAGLWVGQRVFNSTPPAPLDGMILLSRVQPAFLAPEELRRLVILYEERISEFTTPSDYLSLGGLYMEQARTTGDLERFLAAEAAFEQAARLQPEDLAGRIGVARARLALHRFEEARNTIDEVLATAPERPDALVVSGDISLAVGDLAAARSAFAAVDAQVPESPAVQVRMAQLTWLVGDHQRAFDLAAAAVAGSEALVPRGRAWYESFAGSIAFDVGRLDDARRLAELAAQHDPDAVLTSLTLGRVDAAEGDLDGALALFRRAADRIPEPATLAMLGDLHLLRGETEEAQVQYDTALAIVGLGQAQGAVYDRQAVYFLADHGLEPDLAVTLSQNELQLRSDPLAFDAHAWALYSAGLFEDARRFSDQALEDGFRSAPALFHAGMISVALGDDARAERELRAALAINDRFHPLQAIDARRELDRLTG